MPVLPGSVTVHTDPEPIRVTRPEDVPNPTDPLPLVEISPPPAEVSIFPPADVLMLPPPDVSILPPLLEPIPAVLTLPPLPEPAPPTVEIEPPDELLFASVITDPAANDAPSDCMESVPPAPPPPLILLTFNGS